MLAHSTVVRGTPGMDEVVELPEQHATFIDAVEYVAVAVGRAGPSLPVVDVNDEGLEAVAIFDADGGVYAVLKEAILLPVLDEELFGGMLVHRIRVQCSLSPVLDAVLPDQPAGVSAGLGRRWYSSRSAWLVRRRYSVVRPTQLLVTLPPCRYQLSSMSTQALSARRRDSSSL